MTNQTVTTPTISTPRNVGRIVLRNTLVITAGEWLLRAINAIYTITVVRFLGEAGYGSYATITAFVGIFGILFELGTSQYVERAIAQDKERARELLWNLVVFRLILATIGVAVISLIGKLIGYDQQIVLGIFIYTTTFWMAALLMPLTAVLTANERFDITTVIDVIGRILTIGLGILLLFHFRSFMALVTVGLIAMPIQIAISFWAIKHFQLGQLPWRLDLRAWRPIIMASIPFALTSLSLTLNFSVDSVVISVFRSVQEVGWYGAAYGLVFSLASIARGFWRSLTPSLAREHVHNPEQVRIWIRASIQGLAICAFPVTVGTSLLAPQLIELLFGASYAPAGPVLRLIIWDLPLLMFNAFSGNVTAAMVEERTASRIYATSAGLNLVLNLLLTPRFGIIAAAAITVITDLIASIRFYWLLHRKSDLQVVHSRLGRAILAALLMGVPVIGMAQLSLFGAIGAGAICYALLAIMLRVVEPALLLTLIRRLLRHPKTETRE